jgi:hypothetical protein
MESINLASIIIKQKWKWIWTVAVVKRGNALYIKARRTRLTDIQNLKKSCWYYLFTYLRFIGIHFTVLRYKSSNLRANTANKSIKKNGQSSSIGNILQRQQNDEKQEKTKKGTKNRIRWESTYLRCSRKVSGSWILKDKRRFTHNQIR